MTELDKITIYYDASCALCSTEILNLKRFDEGDTIDLVDCSAPGFDTKPFAADNISQEDMMNALHLRDEKGVWYVGVEAFEKMYHHIGFSKIAKMCRHPITKPVAQAVYPMIVRHRYILSKIGMVQFLNIWGKIAARGAEKKSQECKDGACKN